MKTIEKKNYDAPLMEVVVMQNKCVLMAGSGYNADVSDRDNGTVDVGYPDD